MKLLDCTIRDGGYYTNWDFDRNLVLSYLESFNSLPVDYIEIGFRTTPVNYYAGEYFYSPDYVLEEAREISNKKLAIILNEKDVRAEDVEKVLSPCKGLIDMVRIAINPANFQRALKFGETVKKLGFDICFNVMYMSDWDKYKEFQELISELDGLVTYLYMVDSFGGVYPEDVKKTMDMIRSKTDVPIGFHGHNNLELALINTLTAKEYGAEILDGTITGMGRGAGNLKTELLLTALNANDDLEVDFNALSKIVNDFEELQKKYEWGARLPYMVSGANSFPQKQVMEWVSQRFYSYNSIIRSIKNKKLEQTDNRQLPNLNSGKLYKKAIIIGGGPNAAHHARAIGEYSEKEHNVCIIHASSRNAKHYNDVNADQYFCLIGNEGHRIEQMFREMGNFDGICILPPYPRPMGTYIPSMVEENTYEMPGYFLDSFPQDSSTALALETARFLGCGQVLVAGYDGYTDEFMGEKEQMLFVENDEIFEAFDEIGGLKLASITPTKYQNLDLISIYSLLTFGNKVLDKNE